MMGSMGASGGCYPHNYQDPYPPSGPPMFPAMSVNVSMNMNIGMSANMGYSPDPTLQHQVNIAHTDVKK